MSTLGPIVAASALLAVAAAGSAADTVGVGGVGLNDRERDIRPGLAQAGCRPVLTRLSQHACGMQISAWGSPVIATFVFDGDPERRLAVIIARFEADDADRIERALVAEYGAPEPGEAGDPCWKRGEAVIWMQRAQRRVVFARPEHVARVNAP